MPVCMARRLPIPFVQLQFLPMDDCEPEPELASDVLANLEPEPEPQLAGGVKAHTNVRARGRRKPGQI